jgi:hypothetical protein
MWRIYCFVGDKAFLPKSEPGIVLSFGELPLKYDSHEKRGDTVEIHFYFMYNNDNVLPSDCIANCSVVSGAGFSYSSGKLLYFWSPSGYTITLSGEGNRFKNSLQPDVLNYIKTKQKFLAPAFRYLAQENGIILK